MEKISELDVRLETLGNELDARLEALDRTVSQEALDDQERFQALEHQMIEVDYFYVNESSFSLLNSDCLWTWTVNEGQTLNFSANLSTGRNSHVSESEY